MNHLELAVFAWKEAKALCSNRGVYLNSDKSLQEIMRVSGLIFLHLSEPVGEEE